MILRIFLIVIFILCVHFFMRLSSNRVKTKNRSKYNKFLPTQSEIYAVKKQIEENGFWQEMYEWKQFTDTQCRIEPFEESGRKIYMTTIQCEAKIKIPAKTIERAIHFKKIYESLQQELYHEIGWASWKSKNTF
ncbi:hypothetical protein JI747_011280 [Chryseobacterium sp. RG1]|uniref:Uncharacterized protein n=1 Tax=Chryseobacterium tagetis TaxID=2801334 RepID=A0ABS8A349_9FLAO|nr:hypothetical protein [Chryseobacterium tagetis]MCA6067763.1 hypothetical protein [Chryseobacterium tagetis]